MAKLAYLFLVCIMLSFSAHAVDCEALKKQKFKISDNPASVRTALAKFKSCGFDTLDLYHMMPPLISTFVAKMASGDGADLTYGDILTVMQAAKRMPQYAEQKARMKYQLENPRIAGTEEVRTQTTWLCDTPNNGYYYKYNLPQELNELGVYYSYRQALECARKNNKKLLVYFTCILCVNARKMETSVLADEQVKKLLRKDYIVAVLVTDSKQEGEWLASFQQKQFNSNSQPSFYIVDQKEKKIAEMFYDPSVERFLVFLSKK